MEPTAQLRASDKPARSAFCVLPPGDLFGNDADNRSTPGGNSRTGRAGFVLHFCDGRASRRAMQREVGHARARS